VTRVMVDAGICGFTVTIEVCKVDARTVRVVIASDCETVSKWGEQLGHLDWQESLKHPGNFLFFESAFRHIRHAACPIPIAVLKAIEVEVGVAAPKNVNIWFHDADEG